MKKTMLIMLVAVITIVTACAQKDGQTETVTNELNATMTVPEEVSKGQDIKLKVKVTHGEEDVKDADEVTFELWKGSNKDESEKIQAKHVKDGVYQVETSFEEDGIYFVQSHVSAKGLYAMPIQHVFSGYVSEEEREAEEEKSNHHHSEDGHEH
ncbi:FixH family protein [Rossellomorea aquimaris]|uniref:FixH family protein n=1 Tax=Rossellomorea aquimaris TaxID=189382 RepID=UPI001CD35C35|nr:FixH family protein [Rossellomorea aquimaris]MCA1055752.1 FixH family protein [Rossellomorea aquimaris]